MLKRNPNFGIAYYNRGLIFEQRGQWDKAIADFSEAIRCMPGSAPAFVERARNYAAKDDLESALASVDAAIGIDFKLAAAYEVRSEIYRRKGVSEKSRQDEAELARLTEPLPTASKSYLPSIPVADLFARAQNSENNGEFDQAIALYNEAIGRNPNTPKMSVAIMNRGNIHLRQGDLEKALHDYDQALRLDPANASGYANRGNVYARKRLWSESLADYNEALRRKPNFPEALVNRSLTYIAKKEWDNAFRDLDSAITLNSKFAPGYFYRGTVFATRGEFAKAALEFHTAIQLAGETEPAWWNAMAWFLATCPNKVGRDGRQAISAARKACELTEWKNWGYVDTLAAAFAEGGDFDQAIKYQTQALEGKDISEQNRSGMKKRLALYQNKKPYREKPKR